MAARSILSPFNLKLIGSRTLQPLQKQKYSVCLNCNNKCLVNSSNVLVKKSENKG